jgi:hypothetical protein
MVAIPIMLISWQARYGRIKTDDPDFKSARRNRTIAFFVWLPTVVVLIAAVVIFKASW